MKEIGELWPLAVVLMFIVAALLIAFGIQQFGVWLLYVKPRRPCDKRNGKHR